MITKGVFCTMKVLSLFSGIGAYEKALTNLGIPYTLQNFCEIDKDAIQSYCAIHNVDAALNLGDITKVNLDQLPEADLIVHGSPCQDYSVAGHNLGGDMGSTTRSSLMWNSVEIIKRIQPKYVVWENVKGILQKKHKHNLEKYLADLTDMGYTSYYTLLNANDFGIPQNRVRIFVVSIRKDLNQSFTFPTPTGKPCAVKDFLDIVPEQKYIVTNKKLNDLLRQLELRAEKGYTDTNLWREQLQDIKGTIGYKFTKNYLQYDLSGKKYNSQDQRAYYDTGVIGTLMSTQTGGKSKVLIGSESLQKGEKGQIEVRTISPREAFRLMGFTDADFDKVTQHTTALTKLYRQAGNSIVVPVLEAIFKELLMQ